MNHVVHFLIRWGSFGLLAALIVTIALFGPAGRLSFDQSIESLYATDNPHLQAYTQSKNLFGGDEFAFVAYTDPKLYSEDSQAELVRLAETLAEIPGVIPGSVQNLATSLKPAKIPFVAISEDQLKDLFRGILVGEDDQTTAVVVRIQGEHVASVPRRDTIQQIRDKAAEFGRRTGHEMSVVGEPVQVHDMFRYVEEDGLWLWIYSAGLLILVIFTLFRSLRWTLLPVLVVLVTVVWTRGLLSLSHMELSMVSSMLNSLVTIIGIATVIHVAVLYREYRREREAVDALRLALTELAPAIFWTCATTAAGFAAITSSSISPVQSFGIMMTLGTLLVLPAVSSILPGGALIGPLGTRLGQAPAEDWLGRLLGMVTHSVERHPYRLATVSLLLVLFALGGLTRLRMETDFSKNFRESSPIVQGLNFVEERLGGAGTWEVNFAAPDTLNAEFYQEVDELAEKLRALSDENGPQLTKVVAISDGVQLIPSIPFLTMRLQQKLNMLNRFQPEFAPSLYNPEQHRMRIMLRAYERQPSEVKLKLIEEVERIARESFPDAKTTGLYVLLAYLIESLMQDQWTSFGLAACGIFGLMTLAFRSLWIGLISLVPNLFPIVLVIGTMGWIDMPINIATAMIASVSMGLTVDSSIHFLSAYRRSRQAGADFLTAIHSTHQGVGRALVFANLALIAGFLVLTVSHFIPLVHFGILVGVAMFGGLVGNLILLPLLLQIGQSTSKVSPH